MGSERVSLKRGFGNSDGNCVAMLDDVIKHIFVSCDAEGVGMVETSTLITFISPFLHAAVSAVAELKKYLDPNDSNTAIDIITFHNCMKQWILKMTSLGRAMEAAESHNITSSGDQRCSEQLTMERKRGDENEVELSIMKKHEEERLENLVLTMEKQMEALNDALRETQKENEKLEEKNAKLAKKNEKALEEVVSLHKEIEVWKRNLNSAEEVNCSFKKEHVRLQKIIEQCNIEVDKLKCEKGSMERVMLKSVCSSHSIPGVFRSNSFILLKTNSAPKNTPNQEVKSVFDNTSQHQWSPITISSVDKTDDTPNDQDLLSYASKESNSREELSVKLHFMAANIYSNESFQNEISKATSDCSSSSERECNHKLVYHEKRVINIQSETMQNIEKQIPDLEELPKISRDYELKIAQLNNEVLDVRTQLSLTSEKEAMLLERNQLLEETLSSKISQITEMTTKLNENQSKELESKIERLENDNNVKYAKIVDLTIEIHRLNLETSKKSDIENEANLEEALKELKEARTEKMQMEDRLKSMETERNTLRIEIDTLLVKIKNLKEKKCDFEIDNLKSKNGNLLIKNSTMQNSISESMQTIRKLEMEKETVESDNELMKNEKEKMRIENEKLRMDFAILQSKSANFAIASSKSSSSTPEREQRDLIELGFKLKLENLEKEKNLIYEDRQRLYNEITFLNQERDNMFYEIRRLRKQLRFKEEEFDMELDKSQKDLNSSIAEKHELEDEIYRLGKELQQLVSLKTQHEELTQRCRELGEKVTRTEESNSDIDTLRKQKENYEELKEKYMRNSEEMLVLKSEKQSLNSQLKSLRSEVEEYKTMMEECKNVKEQQNEKLQKMIVDKTYLQNEVKELRNDLSGLLQKNEEISFGLQKAKSESTMFKNDKYVLQIEYEKLKEKLKEFETLHQKHDELSNVLENSKKDCDILRVTNDICEQSRKDLNHKYSKDLENYKNELERIEDENEALQRENFGLKSNINILDGEIFQLKDKISYFHGEKQESDEIKYSLVRENQELTSKLDKVNLTLKSMEIENKQLSVENFDLKTHVQESEMTIASNISMNDKLMATNEELNEILQRKEQLITEMKNEVNALRDINQIETKKLSETLREFEDTKIYLKVKEEYIVETEKEAKILKETKQTLNEEIFLLKEMYEKNKHELEIIENQLKIFESLVMEKDEILRNKELIISDLQGEIDHKLREISDVNRESEKVKKLCGELEATKRKLQDQQRRSHDDLEKYKIKNHHLEELVETLKIEIGNINKETHEKSMQLQNLEINFNRLLLENNSLKDNQKQSHLLDEVDFTEYGQREIEKYKMETAKLKSKITILFAEKTAIVNRLKNVEREYESIKNELEGLLLEKQSWLFQNNEMNNINTETMKSDDSYERCKSDSKIIPKRSNFDKLNIRKDKLERKVHDLEKELVREKKASAQTVIQKSTIEKEFVVLKTENDNLKARLVNVEEEVDTLKKEVNKRSNEEINKLVMELDNYKKRLHELTKVMEEERDLKITIYGQLHDLRETLEEKRFELERFTVTVGTSFKIPEDLLRKILISEVSTSQRTPVNLFHFTNEISRVQEQMEITSNILDYLVTTKMKTIYQNIGCQTDVPRPGQKRPRSSTFTLGPSFLIPKQHRMTSDPVEDICWLKNLKFASSGDAGRVRDVGVLFPTLPYGEENSGIADEDLKDQEASPTFNENILNDMDLLQKGRSSFAGIPYAELEAMFNRIARAFTMDSVSVAARHATQASKLTSKQQQLAGELMACKNLLENSLGGEQLIMALRHLEVVLNRSAELSISAALFGSLKQERLMANCVGLMIHYATWLKRRLRNVEDELRFTSQHIKVDSPHKLLLTNFEIVRSRSDSTEGVASRTNVLEINVSPRPSTRVKEVITKCWIVWMVFLTICCFLLLSVLRWGGDSVHLMLPWEWRSFYNSWPPFLAKRYVNSPPPT